MLEIKNLNINKKTEKRELIRDLSFVLNEGDKFAVIGLEGIGKSTLLKTILNQEELDYVDIQGEVNSKHLIIGYLPQSIKENWSDQTVLDYLLKSHPDQEINPEQYQMLAVLEKTLNQLNFDLNAYEDTKLMTEFSGGEVVKLGLTKLLIREPDVLLLDEPTNDLDLQTILFLEDFITNQTRPILFISHDEALLENTANGIIHLTQIKAKQEARSFFKKTSYTDYVRERNLAFTNQEMVARKQRHNFKKKMERFRQIYQKVEHLQNQSVRNPTQGRLLKKKMHSLKSTEARYLKEKEQFVDIPEREEEINFFFEDIEAIHNNKVILDYHNDELKIETKVLARNIDFLVKGPMKIAIIGKNGSGKTTLLRDFVKILNKNETLQVGYMSQHYDDQLHPEDSVLNLVVKDKKKDSITNARKILGNLGFTSEEMEYKQKSLSGGQKAKLLLLKMVLEKDNVLILDEPTRNLSPLSIPVIHKMLLEFRGTIIAVTHDRNFIDNVFDEVYVLEEDGLKKL